MYRHVMTTNTPCNDTHSLQWIMVRQHNGTAWILYMTLSMAVQSLSKHLQPGHRVIMCWAAQQNHLLHGPQMFSATGYAIIHLLGVHVLSTVREDPSQHCSKGQLWQRQQQASCNTGQGVSLWQTPPWNINRSFGEYHHWWRWNGGSSMQLHGPGLSTHL